MKRYESGTKAEAGIYLNVPGRRFMSFEEADHLPVIQKGHWVRVPDLFLLLGTPAIGLTYAVVLPALGLVLGFRRPKRPHPALLDNGAV